MGQDWIRGKYSKSKIQDKAIITMLNPIAFEGRYNVFECDNGKLVVVFSDQKELLNYVESNQNSLFAVRLLEPDCKYFSYKIKTESLGEIVVFTVGSVKSLISNVQGTYKVDNELMVVKLTPNC